MQKRFWWISASIGLAVIPGTSSGQQANAGAAITSDQVSVPDLSFTPDTDSEKNYWKYNYFHQSGVQFSTAMADLRECRKRSAISGLGLLNGFVPYGRTTAGPTARGQFSSSYGLVGGVIAGAAISGVMAHNRRANLRECMGFKGYRQYGLPKRIWESINPDDAEMADAIQAKIASGPLPLTQSLR